MLSGEGRILEKLGARGRREENKKTGKLQMVIFRKTNLKKKSLLPKTKFNPVLSQCHSCLFSLLSQCPFESLAIKKPSGLKRIAFKAVSHLCI